MCGIAGIWRMAGPVSDADVADVKAMMGALSHRGPDAEGAWNGSRLALGHRRLSIFDPAPAAGQPMLTDGGDGVLVYNGAVYNFEGLRADLVREGSVFRTGSDTEVVLEALRRWGPAKAVTLFDGMFAFAYVGILWMVLHDSWPEDAVHAEGIASPDRSADHKVPSAGKEVLVDGTKRPEAARVAQRAASTSAARPSNPLDGLRAFRYLEQICEIGPRPSGSAGTCMPSGRSIT